MGVGWRNGVGRMGVDGETWGGVGIWGGEDGGGVEDGETCMGKMRGTWGGVEDEETWGGEDEGWGGR